MSTPAPERGQCLDRISTVFHQLGGSATIDDVLAHIRTTKTPPALTMYLLDIGWKKLIGDYFRTKNDDGLPIAPDIGENVHMQLELFTLEDYQWVIQQQLRASKTARKQAEKYQAHCFERLGVWIDLDTMGEEETG